MSFAKHLIFILFKENLYFVFSQVTLKKNVAIHIIFEVPKALQILVLHKYLYIFVCIHISTIFNSHPNLLQKVHFQMKANILFENGFTFF